MEKKLYRIVHTEKLEGWWNIEASSPKEALEEFNHMVEDGKIDFSDLEMIDAGNRVEENMSDNIRRVRYRGTQSGEDLYWCSATGKMYIRQECDKNHVRWLTCVKWTGGYEADCPIREGIVFEIEDKLGTLLYVEVVQKEMGYDMTVAPKMAPFFGEEISDIADAVRLGYRLTDHSAWRKWLVDSMTKIDYKGYADNFLYVDVNRGGRKKRQTFSALGVDIILTEEQEEHKLVNYKWVTYELCSPDKQSCYAICGYELINGGLT